MEQKHTKGLTTKQYKYTTNTYKRNRKRNGSKGDKKRKRKGKTCVLRVSVRRTGNRDVYFTDILQYY